MQRNVLRLYVLELIPYPLMYVRSAATSKYSKKSSRGSFFKSENCHYPRLKNAFKKRVRIWYRSACLLAGIAFYKSVVYNISSCASGHVALSWKVSSELRTYCRVCSSEAIWVNKSFGWIALSRCSGVMPRKDCNKRATWSTWSDPLELVFLKEQPK